MYVQLTWLAAYPSLWLDCIDCWLSLHCAHSRGWCYEPTNPVQHLQLNTHTVLASPVCGVASGGVPCEQDLGLCEQDHPCCLRASVHGSADTWHHMAFGLDSTFVMRLYTCRRWVCWLTGVLSQPSASRRAVSSIGISFA